MSSNESLLLFKRRKKSSFFLWSLLMVQSKWKSKLNNFRRWSLKPIYVSEFVFFFCCCSPSLFRHFFFFSCQIFWIQTSFRDHFFFQVKLFFPLYESLVSLSFISIITACDQLDVERRQAKKKKAPCFVVQMKMSKWISNAFHKKQIYNEIKHGEEEGRKKNMRVRRKKQCWMKQ